MAEMYKNLLLYTRTTHAEYSHQAFIEEFISLTTESSDLPEMVTIKSSCTEYASRLTTKQLEVALKVSYEFSGEPDSDGVVKVIYKNHHHLVQMNDATCSWDSPVDTCLLLEDMKTSPSLRNLW